MIIAKASVTNGILLFKKSAEHNLPVVFPTDTIYGIGAPLSAIHANKRIFTIKKRPLNLPFPILAASLNQVAQIADLSNLSSEAMQYVSKWPGPYTFILKSKPSLNDIYSKNGTVAVRIPNIDWLRKTLEAIGEPITATSANFSGQQHVSNVQDAVALFNRDISLFIHGQTGASSSTIIDLSNKNIAQIR